MTEAYIQIGDHVLTQAQAMAVRVAVTNFHMEVSEDNEIRAGLGPIADGYRDRLGEVLRVIFKSVSGGVG